MLSTGAAGATGAINNLTTSGTNTISANLILAGASGSTHNFSGASGGTLLLSGTVSSNNSIRLQLGTTGAIYNFASANTYTGTTTQNAGNTILLGNKDALSTTLLQFNNSSGFIGATTNLTGANKILNDISFASTSNETFVNGQAIEFGGAVTLGGTAHTLTNSNAAGATFSGPISGSGTMTFAGTGTTFLRGNSSYSGGNFLTGAGGVNVVNIGKSGSNSNLGTSGTINFGSGNNTGVLRYAGGGETTDKVINIAANGLGGATLEASGSGPVTFTSNMTSSGTGVKTLTLTGTSVGNTISGNILNPSAGSVGVAKDGVGSWTLSGSNSYTGLTSLVNGTLNLDFSATSAPTNNIINSIGTLSLGNASSVASSVTLNVIGKAGTNNVQSLASGSTPNSGPGAFRINVISGSGGTMTLNRGSTSSRTQGMTLDYGIAAGGTVTTTSGTQANGLLSTLATLNKSDFATRNVSGNIIALSNYTASTGSTIGVQDRVTDVTAGNITISATTGSQTVSGIRFNTAGSSTVSLSGARLLAIGGGNSAGPILVTSTVGANTTTITGGLLAGISSRDLVVIQNNTLGDLQIDSRITSLNGNGLGFTKSGSGTVILNSNNAYNATTYINEGTVIVTGSATTGNTQVLTTTAGVATLDGVDTTGMFIGQRVNGTNLFQGATVAGNYIVGLTSTSVTLSSTAASSGTTSVTFGNSGALGTGTGATAVQIASGAKLQIGNGGSTGELIAGQGITSAGTVAFNRSDAFTFSNPIAGTGALVQAGSGTMTLTGSHGFSGATVVDAGKLVMNGTAGLSRAIVNDGGELGGSGLLGGLTVNEDGAVAPGNSIGTLSTNNGSMVWNGQTSGTFAQMKFELSTSGSTSDLINLGTGMFDKGTGNEFYFDFLGTGTSGSTYTLLTFGTTDFVAGDFDYNNLGGGLQGEFLVNANSLQFAVTAIPEPATVALMGIGLSVMVIRFRRNARAA